MMDQVAALKALLPFRLGTTSFIYPDHILPNVRKLGGLFDEIELLIFESEPLESLPGQADIRELALLAGDLDVTYNVHLPVDVSLTDASRTRREHAVDTLVRVMERVAPLHPTTHTLHLDLFPEHRRDPSALGQWQERTGNSLCRFCRSLEDPGSISVETLDYPLGIVDGIIEAAGVEVCMDAGHLMVHGIDVMDFFTNCRWNIPLIHLHGIDFSRMPPRDHLGLDKTPFPVFKQTLEVLKTFSGTVSLEVFNRSNLESSIAFLREWAAGCSA